MSPSTLLVTSSRRPSRHLVLTLLSLSDCPAIRIIVRSKAAIQEVPPQLRSSPHSVVALDGFRGRDFEAAFRDVSIVFHDGPSTQSQDEARSIAIIDAAKQAGVSHFILCSVLHPMRTKLHYHRIKLNIEEHLIESHLDYTILQPAHFMQELVLEKTKISGNIPVTFSSSIIRGFIDAADLACIARNIILHPKQHRMASYELVAQNISYDGIAQITGRLLGKDVQCKLFPIKEFINKMRAAGVVDSDETEDMIERLILYFNRWGLTGNSNVTRWLLQRKPNDWESYIWRELHHCN